MTEILFTLIATHLTIVCVTLFLHRGQAHRGIVFNPILSHPMRFWLWLTTGMVTKEWVASHRKHHRFTDLVGDPHSPVVFGFWRVLLTGAGLYVAAAADKDMVRQYGAGTPDDWLERNVYSRHSALGICLMLIIDVALFHGWGLLIWAVQMLWIPFWAAGVVNGVGHWFGYRNTDTKDNSRNIFPIGLIIGGEELHNNHHANPASAKLSTKWYELDAGWLWLQLFSMLRLATVVKR